MYHIEWNKVQQLRLKYLFHYTVSKVWRNDRMTDIEYAKRNPEAKCMVCTWLKNNTTFFCPTFKVEGKKVVLFFHFELKWKSYGHFKILKLSLFEIKILKWENGHNSLILARNEKITPLSFIQLLNLKERKWCYFCISS